MADASDGNHLTISAFDHNGGHAPVSLSQFDTRSTDTTFWIHVSRDDPQIRQWLTDHTPLDALSVNVLLAEETRPRFFMKGRGLMLILRGVNLNPGADPDDMVSVRAWIDSGLIITVNLRKMMAIGDIRQQLDDTRGPVSPGAFLVELVGRLLFRMADVLDGLNEAIDDLEDKIIDTSVSPLPGEISDLRRTIIRLKRHLAPQREVLIELCSIKSDWLAHEDCLHLREAADRMTRFLEDLEAGRERTAIVRDELDRQSGEKANRTLYVLSMITLIFLPLSLVTGLLGINVQGIPGAGHPFAFFAVCGILLGIVVIQLLILKRKHWL